MLPEQMSHLLSPMHKLRVHELAANSFVNKTFVKGYAELTRDFATRDAIVLHHFDVRRFDTFIDIEPLAIGIMSQLFHSDVNLRNQLRIHLPPPRASAAQAL